MKRSDSAQQAPGGAVLIEALGYRSLRYVSQTLGPFHVLVGPNASGKSTFLDVIAFLGDVVRAGIEAAVHGDPRLGIPHRAPDAKQLTWMRQGTRFELAIELAIPEEKGARIKNGGADVCRYEMAIDVTGPLRIVAETLWLKPMTEMTPQSPRKLFPEPPESPETIVQQPRKTHAEGLEEGCLKGRGT